MFATGGGADNQVIADVVVEHIHFGGLAVLVDEDDVGVGDQRQRGANEDEYGCAGGVGRIS